MRSTPVCALLVLAAALSGPAAADEPKARFTMTPVDKGVLKLDTLTGATSFCSRTDADWTCKSTPDGDQALRRQIEGLQGEIVVLKEQLAKMEDVAGIGDPSRAPPRAVGKMELPTEKDVDQAFDYVERMMKKLRERLNKVEKDNKGPGSL